MGELVVVVPPMTKPTEPCISGLAAAELLRRMGLAARGIDAAIGWQQYVLAPARLETLAAACAAAGGSPAELIAIGRSIRAVSARPPALRQARTYANRRVYTSAVNHLEQVLRWVGRPFPHLRLGIAYVGSDAANGRPESAAWLADMAVRPGPFDDYFCAELIPSFGPRTTHVGLSLTFRQQAPAAMRLAQLVGELRPEVRLLLGGPLVACWRAVGADLNRPPFTRFSRVLDGDDRDLAALASELGAVGVDLDAVLAAAASEPLAPGLDDVAWGGYLAPEPIIPVALGRGCYWRKCSFCPDHLHGPHRPCGAAGLVDWTRRVAARFPDGAMLHLTDSSLPMSYLAALADVVAAERLPIHWYGFVRVEAELADPPFVEHLRRGGCAMLQLGLETASARLLELLGKGATIERAARVCQTLAAAGIRNHAHLLFGLPTETDADREATLAFLTEHDGAIHGLNPALLNLPRRSPMHRHPERFGITEILPFHQTTDLSLYDDFRCGASHPRVEARHWLDHRFFKSAVVKRINANLHSPMKSNHLCFL